MATLPAIKTKIQYNIKIHLPDRQQKIPGTNTRQTLKIKQSINNPNNTYNNYTLTALAGAP